MNFSFSNPSYLLCLLIIPFFILIHFISIKEGKKRALKFANFSAISRISGIDLFSKSILTLLLSSLVVFFLVLSISGMAIHLTRDVSGFSFVIAIDSSVSMSAPDFSPNRLEFSKSVSKEIIEVLPIGTRIGLVSFGAYSFINSELTSNKEVIYGSLGDIEMSGIGGTDFYEAIVTSSNILYNEDGKAIVLFSDGQINIGEVERTLRHALQNNIIIHTIAIATENGGETSQGFVSKLDREVLKALSYQTGGVYIEGINQEEIKELFNKILDLREGPVSIDISVYLLLLALILFVIEFALINFKI